jgi:hypothetical protein
MKKAELLQSVHQQADESGAALGIRQQSDPAQSGAAH